MNTPSQQNFHYSTAAAARTLLQICVLAAFTCALFTVAASWGLVVALVATRAGESTPLLIKLGIKGLLAGAGAVIMAGAWIVLNRRDPAGLPCQSSSTRTESTHGLLVVPALIIVAALVLPRLDAYPWAAPDEMHHFVVARNLADYGLYASGNPERGFKVFDPYDSVSVPVIAPVAAALRVAGASLAAGRLVMAIYFLLLCCALFALAKPVFGSGAAAAGILIMTTSFGSTYLGRALYGEVPALTFVATALILWRRALEDSPPRAWAPLAGVAFAAAVLCKSIIVLSVFPFAGVWLYDRMTFRRIRWPHMIVPGIGAVLFLSCWWVVKAAMRHDLTGSSTWALGMYKPNLMFGLRSVGHAIAWMAADPLALLRLLLALAFVAPIVFRRRYDPPLAVLFLIAVLYAYWWMCFTPAQIPRYVWYGYAIAGLFAGPMLRDALRRIVARDLHLVRRFAAVALVCVVVVPSVQRVTREARGIYTSDEMHDDRELAIAVRDLPESATVQTTYWPLERTLNFLARRNVQVIDAAPNVIAPGTVVIVDERTSPLVAPASEPVRRIGRYTLLTGAKGGVEKATPQQSVPLRTDY